MVNKLLAVFSFIFVVNLTNLLAQCELCEQNLIGLYKQNEQLIEDIDVVQRRADALVVENTRLTTIINQLSAQIDSLNDVVFNLRENIKQLKEEIEEKKRTIAELKKELDYFKEIVTCLESIEENRQQISASARNELDKANELYEDFIYNGNLSNTEKVNKVKDAWEIYTNYGSYEVNENCGSYKIKYKDDYKEGLDHYYMARIIAANDGNVLNDMGDGLSSKLDVMNQMLLSEIGQTMKKGTSYGERSNAKQLVEELPNLLNRLSDLVLTERKDNNRDTTSNETISQIKKIYRFYEKGDFAQSIAIYSKYQRIFDFDEFQVHKDIIDHAKFSAGSILLWNLGNISAYDGLSLPGSWLYKTINEEYQRTIGRELLEGVIEKGRNNELRKRAYIISKKEYQNG